MAYQCFYCLFSTDIYCNIINHLIEIHSQNEIKFKHNAEKNYKVFSYKITPELCREQGRSITIDENKSTIHISRRNLLPKESPLKKIVKREKSDEETECEFLDQEILVDANENEIPECDELIKLLPGVIMALKEVGKEEDFILFNRLVSERKFPLDNIAFLLFLDVVSWFDLDNTSSMRYNDECKLFWRTGYRLFHGRFLRFMGGPKNCGQNQTDKKCYSASKSQVNFVVPDRKILTEQNQIVQKETPGIITDIIDSVSQNDPNQVLTYKICVDGKKINPSSKGEVNLWGFEDHPTYEEKKSRIESEVEMLSSFIDKVGRQIEFGKLHLDESNIDLSNYCNISIKILSNRIKDLRLLKVKKNIALSKIESKIKGDWRASSFSYVISSLRTSIYQIEHCIEDLLNANDKLCQYSASASCIDGGRNCFSVDNKVDLAKQENYVCLVSSDTEAQEPELIKQRSPAWHDIRNSSLVTGSTLNKAIGLEGLKNQKMYLENKSQDKDPEPVSEDLQRKFDYGTENELHAIATFVSTILPAFKPSGSFYEEGCYVHKSNGNTNLVVSPDGSVRTISETVAGIEVKCPMPGKLYTTPVHYILPHYYVPQVLSEMNSLQVDRLYFISYSKDSTAVHMVRHDQTLWNDIVKEIISLDMKLIPKKLSPKIQKLKDNIKCFQNSHVELIAEVKSKVAKPCSHPYNATGRLCHRNNEYSQSEILLSEIHKVFMRAKDCVKESSELCAIKATEVLVFVLADLDRIHKPECPNSFPVAYAFKGYSMKSSAMRNMVEKVLYELYVRGIYTPVVSYDGQWASLAFKSKDGYPLTLLELQRQVFNDVKKRKKSDITKAIFNTCVVNSSENVLDYIDYIYDEKRKTVSVSVKSGVKLWKPSIEIRQLIEEDKQKGKAEKIHIDNCCEENDEIISVLPTEAL